MAEINVSRETFSWRWMTDCGVQVFAGEQTLPLYERLMSARLPGMAELVPADGSLLVVLEPGAVVPPQLFELLERLPAEVPAAATGRRHVIEVDFDGVDLPPVAAKLGLAAGRLADRLCEIEFQVKFLGFQPGFAYLAGLPKAWRLPRLARPRKKVPAGSVAIAGAYCGIYPTEGPGGWHLLGRTASRLFDPAASPPALFRPGDFVRLVPK